MSTEDLEIVFEGKGLASGTINARQLGEALVGCSEVFTRANQILNGEASQSAVLVRANFRHGSFAVEVQLVQETTEYVKQFILAHPIFSASSLAMALGFLKKHKEDLKESLLDLYKLLKGKKPEGVKAISADSTEVTFGQNKKIVNATVVHLYGDSAIRAGLEKMTSPLLQEGVERIALKHGGAEQNVIEKPEAEYFRKDSFFELTDSLVPKEGERDAVLVVSKLSFTEGTTWTFFERGATVIAKIEDEGFWKNVHGHQVTFGEGDMLRVRLRWKIEKKTKLIQRNTIVKVYEIMVGDKQMRFF